MSATRRHAALAERAIAALRGCDLGGWTKAVPTRYWHHWTGAVALDWLAPCDGAGRSGPDGRG